MNVLPQQRICFDVDRGLPQWKTPFTELRHRSGFEWRHAAVQSWNSRRRGALWAGWDSERGAETSGEDKALIVLRRGLPCAHRHSLWFALLILTGSQTHATAWQAWLLCEVSVPASPDNASFIPTPLQKSISYSYKFTDKARWDGTNQMQWPFHRQGNLNQRDLGPRSVRCWSLLRW